MKQLLFLTLSFLSWATPIKIATYNVENLFDATYNGTEYEEYIPGKHNWNKRMVDIKLNHTAEVICDLDADVLGLQEVENRAIFNRLIHLLEKVGCAYKYSAITSKKGAAIQVALLSRYAITKSKDIDVSHTPRVRNILEVNLDIGGQALTVFVNHWKSKAYKGYESKRIKYAKALQARIARLSPSREYIILGDFNSDYNAYLTLSEKNNDTHGKTGFSDILHTKVEEYEIRKAKQGQHYTLWKELPIEDRWSHKFYGKESSLDQIVVPNNMFDAKGIDYVNNSFKVFKAEYLFTKRGYINRWRYKNGKHKAKGYSDHLPVYAYFDTVPYKVGKDTSKTGRIKEKSIDYLYTVEALSYPVLLKDVTVVMKRGNHAIVKQSPHGRGVMLFGCAKNLKEGTRYDLRVESIKSYHGLKEVTTVYKLKTYPSAKVKKFYKTPEQLLQQSLLQNEVITEIKGTYRNRKLTIDDEVLPIYFRNKKLTPPNGSKLKIHYAHLGYYKKLQLVIYSKKDFEIME